jgi:hypothetical protein
MFTPKTGRKRPFFMGVVQRGLGREEILHPKAEAFPEILKQEIFGRAIVINLGQ